jgi:hypothetical protein
MFLTLFIDTFIAEEYEKSNRKVEEWKSKAVTKTILEKTIILKTDKTAFDKTNSSLRRSLTSSLK